MGILRKKGANERGATLVEAAIITPLFFLMLFGIFEMGMLYRSSLTNSNAAKEGSRAASVSGSRADADYLILRSVEHGIAAVGVDDLEHVVVFRASGPIDTVPPACLTSSQSNVCNSYDAASFFKEYRNSAGDETTNFGCDSGRAIDRFWCPSDRATVLGASDYVGVYVSSKHDFVTGFFGASTTLEDTSIVRLEPTGFS